MNVIDFFCRMFALWRIGESSLKNFFIKESSINDVKQFCDNFLPPCLLWYFNLKILDPVDRTLLLRLLPHLWTLLRNRTNSKLRRKKLSIWKISIRCEWNNDRPNDSHICNFTAFKKDDRLWMLKNIFWAENEKILTLFWRPKIVWTS